MLLYKYFAWNASKNPYIRNNLRQSILCFSDPYSFNDPFDISPVFNYQRTGIKHLSKLLQSKEGIARADARRRASKEIKGNPFLNSAEGREKLCKSIAEDLRHSIGVCCFTTHNDNLLMWAHYADQHKAFVSVLIFLTIYLL